MTCTNCGRPVGPGGAGGLDSRCYQYQRRNGTLPPRELLQTDELSRRVTLRLSPAMLLEAKRMADAAGLDLGVWIRRAIQQAMA